MAIRRVRVEIPKPAVLPRVLRWSAMLLAVFVAVVAMSDVVQGHEHTATHRKLTDGAFRLLNSDFLRRDPFLAENEILNLLVEGVIDEDECVASRHGRSWGSVPNYNSHFYEAETKQKLDAVIPPHWITKCADFAEDDRTTAPARAATLWGMATADYKAATLDKRKSAFYVLGRILHLMEDMTSPAHVHNDPHGWVPATAGCDGDIDDFEVWGHCNDESDRISDYVVDSSVPRVCDDGDVPPLTMTCRLWWSLKHLYNGAPQGSRGSDDPVARLDSESNLGYAFVRHVAGITYPFTQFQVKLTDPTNVTDEQPVSELRNMLRGSTIDFCGFGVKDKGLCEVSGAFTISGDFQEIGRTKGRCGRYEGNLDSTEQWWLSLKPCSLSNDVLTGWAYLENSGSFNPEGFVPVRYAKPLFEKLYGTTSNEEDPFKPTPHVGKTLLRIYGDVLYATAVAYGAGLIQTFVDEVARPTADAGGPYVGEACRAITVSGSGSSDPNGSISLYGWDFDGGGLDVQSASPTAKPTFASAGVHTIKLVVTDDEGLSDDDEASVTIGPDITPPAIGAVTATPGVLWPPNHEMTPVTIDVSVQDACNNTRCRIVSVTSNDDGNGRAKGKTVDWIQTDDLRLQLRAERSGGAANRVYTIVVSCEDAAGNRSSREVKVTVPHDRGR